MTVSPQAPPPQKARCTPSTACPCCCPLQLHASGPRWPGWVSHLLLAAAVHCWGAVAAAVLRAALARGAGGVLPTPPTGDKNCRMDSCVAPAPAGASSACRFKAERGCACSVHHCPAAQHSASSARCFKVVAVPAAPHVRCLPRSCAHPAFWSSKWVSVHHALSHSSNRLNSCPQICHSARQHRGTAPTTASSPTTHWTHHNPPK